MTESDEMHQKMSKILRKVESIDNSTTWLIRLNSQPLREELLKFFKKKKSTAKVFLAIDGVKNVNEIASTINMIPNNVSREITILLNMELIEPVIEGRNTVYKKNKIDKILGLSKELSKLPITINEEVNKEDINTENKDGSEGDINFIQDTSDNKE